MQMFKGIFNLFTYASTYTILEIERQSIFGEYGKYSFFTVYKFLVFGLNKTKIPSEAIILNELLKSDVIFQLLVQ